MLRRRVLHHFARIRVIDFQSHHGCVPELFEDRIDGVGFISISLHAMQPAHGTASADRLNRHAVFPSKRLHTAAAGSYHIHLESVRELTGVLADSDMVLLLADRLDMVAVNAMLQTVEVARNAGALVVGVFPRLPTIPGFSYGGHLIEKLFATMDTLLVVPEESDRTTYSKEGAASDSLLLYQGIQSLSDLLHRPGLINVDFADVRSILSQGRIGVLSVGHAVGLHQAPKAIWSVLKRMPQNASIDGARGVLVNVTGGRNMCIQDIRRIAETVIARAHAQADFVLGAVVDEALEDELRIALIATGMRAAHWA